MERPILNTNWESQHYNNTGSLFCLTIIICYLPPLLCRPCGRPAEWTRLVW